jgi:3'-phosphoadenosine 5'-phosphosulfate sulfotransferase (PAPS reductase)/FAD synthetase
MLSCIKKKPFDKYAKETGRVPFIGTMAIDSHQRKIQYLKSGCNAFTANRPVSTPLSFWNESNVWEYIKKYKLPYSKIYDMGEKRTGCMFCMFGVHLEKGENRFQRMKKSHPKQYNYCINKLKLGKILSCINVPYGDYKQNLLPFL